MLNRIIEDIKNHIFVALKQKFNCTDSFLIAAPNKNEDCDYYSNFALTLSKTISKKPFTIASEIKKIVLKDHPNTYSKIVISDTGFFNIYLSDALFLKNLIHTSDHKFLQKPKKKINIESICANPTGYMHVGHLRNAVYAETLKKILTYAGHQVTSIYYNNNAGNQINVCVQSVVGKYFELENENYINNFLDYKGKEIREAAQNITFNFSQEQFNFKDFHSKAFVEAKKQIIDYFTAQIKKDIASIQIKFDFWFNEQTLYDNNFKKIKTLLGKLKDKNVTYQKDGATWIKTNSFGDDKDRVLIKSDKSYTYILPDAAYHYERITKKYDELINVWGEDHYGYVKRLKTLCELMGLNHKNLIIPLLGLVKLTKNNKEVKMSKRSGVSFWWRSLISEIGKDAAYFFLLSNSGESSIEINFEKIKVQTKENLLYYCQYVLARCHHVLIRLENIEDPSSIENYCFTSEEKNLIKTLLSYQSAFETVIQKKDPVFLLRYIVSLAAKFHKFYNENKIVNSLKQEQIVRTFLTVQVQSKMRILLQLFSISTPNKM